MCLVVEIEVDGHWQRKLATDDDKAVSATVNYYRGKGIRTRVVTAGCNPEPCVRESAYIWKN